MKKYVYATLFVIFITVLFQNALALTPPPPLRYPPPIFDDIEELIEWFETVDARFRGGQYANEVICVRNEGEILIPRLNKIDAVLDTIGFSTVIGGRLTTGFHYSTPVGRMSVRVRRLNSAETKIYEEEGLIGYINSKGWDNEVREPYLSYGEKTITVYDTFGESTEYIVPYELMNMLDVEDIPVDLDAPVYPSSNPQSFIPVATIHFIIEDRHVSIQIHDEANLNYIDAITFNTFSIVDRELPVLNREIRFEIGETAYTINNLLFTNDVAPFIHPDFERAMVPLRAVTQALSAEVDWFPEINEVVIYNGTEFNMFIDEPLPNNMGIPMLIDDRVFVPVRYVADTLGATVRWDSENSAVYIYN